MTMKIAAIRPILIALVAMLPVTVQALDCGRATSNVEKLICGNDQQLEHRQLQWLDGILNQQYRLFLAKTSHPEQLKADQVNWLKHVRDKCTSTSCLKSAYESRIRRLAEAMGAWCEKQMPLFDNDWARIGEDGFFEEFSAGASGDFGSWHHHRPDIANGSWQSKGCFIEISRSDGSLNLQWILLDVTKSRLRVIDLDPSVPGISRYRVIR